MEYLMDYHLHTSYSMDSKANIYETCEYAIKHNIKEICFTEHYSKVENDRSNGYLVKEDYIKDIENCRKKYPSLVIRLGLEIGECHINKNLIYEDLKDMPIDFIIGSLHKINGIGITKIMNNYDIHKLYHDYFKNLYDLVCYGDYDVIGHLDLVQRYTFEKDGVYQLEDYQEWIEKILKKIIERNKGIEVNTSSLEKIHDTMPRFSVLELYYRLGGKIITVGSDSHTSIGVGNHIKEVYEELKKIGFTSVYAYCGRKLKEYAL